MDNKESTRVFLNRLVMAAIFIIIWAGLTYRLIITGIDMGFSTIWIFSLVLFFQVFMFWAGRTLYRFAKSQGKGQQHSDDSKYQ
jgi:hypothetical protein